MRIGIWSIVALFAVLVFGQSQSSPAQTLPPMVAQAPVPAAGTGGDQNPISIEQRYQRRFPQPARVGDLVGLPVLDRRASTIGFVRQVVRTPDGKIKLVINYSRWWGWFGRPVAAPLEALGVAGRQVVSLDLEPHDYATTPTWQAGGGEALENDATIRVALARF